MTNNTSAEAQDKTAQNHSESAPDTQTSTASGTADQNQTTSSSTEPSSTPKRKNRKLKGTDTPTAEEEKKMKELEEFIESMPRSAFKVAKFFVELKPILSLLLGFLQITLPENLYRFTMGILSVHTDLTNKMVAGCGHCSTKTVSRARQEVFSNMSPDFRRQRKRGAGRKRLSVTDPEVAAVIMKYVEYRAYGPCTKETTNYTAATLEGIQKHLQRKFGRKFSCTAIRSILLENGYKPHKNKKYLYGNQATETEAQRIIRHAQFEYINELFDSDDPNYIFLSGDCKKKEYLGNFTQGGRSWSQSGIQCQDHSYYKALNVKTLTDLNDLLECQEGKAIPYGIYDIKMNKGYVNVGITHDTAAFVAESIFRFIEEIKADHPNANTIVFFCDGGGSNSASHYDFKYQMARLSKRINMKILIVHYPPYRSKFNKIERKMFAFMSKNFERQPLLNLQLVMDLIKQTKTRKGLTIRVELDTNYYPLKQKPTPEQMSAINIEYVGPTKNEKTKLSYIIDGSNLSDELFPLDVEYKTVFDLDANFDLSSDEKEELTAKKQSSRKRQGPRKSKKSASKQKKAAAN